MNKITVYSAQQTKPEVNEPTQKFNYLPYLEKYHAIPPDYSVTSMRNAISKFKQVFTPSVNTIDACTIIASTLCRKDYPWNTRKASLTRFRDTGIPVFEGVSRTIDPIHKITEMILASYRSDAENERVKLNEADIFTIAFVFSYYLEQQLKNIRFHHAEELNHICELSGTFSDTYRTLETRDLLDNAEPITLNIDSAAIINAFKSFIACHNLPAA